MEICDLTEIECSEFLTNTARDFGEKSVRCITTSRQQSHRSLTRTVRFALVVSVNNMRLLDYIIEKCLEKDKELWFVGSEANLQGDLEIDYFYFEAKILAKIKD